MEGGSVVGARYPGRLKSTYVLLRGTVSREDNCKDNCKACVVQAVQV